ncbi:MAG: hypothetical protein KKB02_15375 [Alphaproteobacteria bacterium]|nr:hypothetical protein [Alphaproteobacteria bacterium]
MAAVYLDGTWHLVDATGMAAANQIARIGVGLDAAELSFCSSFGQVTSQHRSVQVTADEEAAAGTHFVSPPRFAAFDARDPADGAVTAKAAEAEDQDGTAGAIGENDDGENDGN